MSQKPETVFKERVLPSLKRLPYSYWIKIQQVCKRGDPDIVGCIKGQMVVLELKEAPGIEPDPLQMFHLQQAADAHALCFVVNPQNWSPTYDILKNLSCPKKRSRKKYKAGDLQ